MSWLCLQYKTLLRQNDTRKTHQKSENPLNNFAKAKLLRGFSGGVGG